MLCTVRYIISWFLVDVFGILCWLFCLFGGILLVFGACLFLVTGLVFFLKGGGTSFDIMS